MRAPAQYRAMHDLQIPGSYAFAVRAGDDVTEGQRANMHWVVGQDLEPLGPDSMARPEDDADRRDWQDYAVVSGVPYDEAVNLDRADLVRAADAAAKQEAPPAAASMPEEQDLKAEWVAWASAEMARESGSAADPDALHSVADRHTKADLIAAFGAQPDAELRGEMLAEAGDAEGSGK